MRLIGYGRVSKSGLQPMMNHYGMKSYINIIINRLCHWSTTHIYIPLSFISSSSVLFRKVNLCICKAQNQIIWCIDNDKYYLSSTLPLVFSSSLENKLEFVDKCSSPKIKQLVDRQIIKLRKDIPCFVWRVSFSKESSSVFC